MKRLNLFIVLLLASFSCKAQLPSFKMESTALIENAVREGIYIIRTSYSLKEVASGDLYGLDGQTYFGELYSIGYALPDGWIAIGDITSPWEKDHNFDKYQNDENYIPVLSDSLQITSIVPDYNTTFSIRANLKVDTDANFTRIKAHKAYPRPLLYKSASNDDKGWIIWCTVDEKETLKNSSEVALTATSYNLSADKFGFPVENTPYGRKVIGGFYIIPDIKEPGHIQFYVEGLLQPMGDRWIIVPAPTDLVKRTKSESDVNSRQVEPSNDEGKLTKVPNKKTTRKRK